MAAVATAVAAVVAAVAACRKFDAPVLPRGAGTSLAGQCCNVAVVFDFTKYMNRILHVDFEKRTARMQPGVILDTLRAHAPDAGVVAAYGKLIPAHLLSLPRLGMVNVHASLLPKYRGAAPVHRAIINGDTETGVTIMQVVEALDAGDMLAKAARPIGPDETSEELERALADDGHHESGSWTFKVS